MGDKRTKQVLTIIVCIGLIIASIFWKAFKDGPGAAQESKGAEININTEGQVSDKVPLINSRVQESDEEDPGDTVPDQERASDKKVEINHISEIDTTLYEYNPESEAAPDGKEIRIALTNGEILYSGGYPSGIFKNMMANIQDYINANITESEKITEVAIDEASISEDKEKKRLKYDILLNEGTKVAVEIDLHTFKYQFAVK